MKLRIGIFMGVIVALLIAFVPAYSFSPVSVKLYLARLSGEAVYEYQYSEKGTAIILQDDGEQTISFVDMNIVGPFGIVGPRGYAVYDMETGEIIKLHGFDNIANQYGIVTYYNDNIITISIQIPQIVDGIQDIHLFQYGIRKGNDQDELLYRNEVGDMIVFAKYVASW